MATVVAAAAAGIALLLKFGPTNANKQRTQDHVAANETGPTLEQTIQSSPEMDQITQDYLAKSKEIRETPVTKTMIATLGIQISMTGFGVGL